MYGSILTLMLLTGANPGGAGCVGCGQAGAFSPYYCRHRQYDRNPGQEVYAQTSPHRPYPARTAWMFRYTYFYGINYARPIDYRLLYDYPWHKRGDDLPRVTTEQLIEAQEEWVPAEEIEGYDEYELHDSVPAPTSAATDRKQPSRSRSALTVKRAVR